MKRMIIRVAAGLALAAGVMGVAAAWAADAPPIRIGYAIARTGPWAPGAQATQEPNYLLWADQVNAAGGLSVNGVKRKVELIGYDDRSDAETAVRTYQKLMATDKVDLILPPWGTNANFAVAPLANRLGYPMVSPTCLSRELLDKKYANFFCILQQADKMVGAAVDMMAAKKIKTVAVVYLDELFGLECKAAFDKAIAGKGIEVIEAKSVPLGTNDLSGVLQDIKLKNPEAMVAFTYPPETILASKQSQAIGFNPKLFFSAVGVAFPFYSGVMGPNANGVSGMGLWNKKTSPQTAAYHDAYVKKFGKEPDQWGGAVAMAGLQVLQQAVETVGLDHKKIRDFIASKEMTTLIGKVKFTGSENVSTPGAVGQWQNDQFEIVWPKDRETADLVYPKPAWN